MDQPYSFLADCLSKFHMASEPIQALWLLAMVAIILGVTGLVARAAVEIARIRHHPGVPFSGAASQMPTRFIDSTAVMPGLDPGTHASTHGGERKPWVAGSSPAMTESWSDVG